MTTTRETPPGATLHLGGTAYAAPALEPLLVPFSSTEPAGNTVIPYPGNPRRHDQDAITGSVREHGLYQGIVCQRSTGHVLVGNGRLQALTDLGAERVPVTWLDVDDVRAAAIVAVDNRTGDLSWNDTTDLLNLLAPLASDPEVLALAGYTGDDLIDLERMAANLAFVEDVLSGSVTDPGPQTGTPLSDVADPIDLDGDAEKVTVTLDPGHRQDLYALLKDVGYVRNITNTYVRKPE